VIELFSSSGTPGVLFCILYLLYPDFQFCSQKYTARYCTLPPHSHDNAQRKAQRWLAVHACLVLGVYKGLARLLYNVSFSQQLQSNEHAGGGRIELLSPWGRPGSFCLLHFLLERRLAGTCRCARLQKTYRPICASGVGEIVSPTQKRLSSRSPLVRLNPGGLLSSEQAEEEHEGFRRECTLCVKLKEAYFPLQRTWGSDFRGALEGFGLSVSFGSVLLLTS
jgi:hypothetical protein